MKTPRINRRQWGQNIARMARTMPRHDFIAHHVAAMTVVAKNRALAGNMQVWPVGERWVYGFALGRERVPLSAIPLSADLLYDQIRRTPLNLFVAEAERLRELAHA